MSLKKSTSFSLEDKKSWHLIDAKMDNFGRIASRVANLLQGKHKPTYSPQGDCGDFVIVVNASLLKTSHPEKWRKKVYYHHSGYPGGIKEKTLLEAYNQDPTEVIRKAVYNMLPKNKLRARELNRLKIYVDEKEGRELFEAMRKKAVPTA